ncbi:MAG: twin-arginine translocase subunit TatC, partial [Candidatus Promineifilaceae bacterium]
NFMPQVFTTDWTSQEYISFVLRLIFWLGVSFQLPIIVYFLSRVGLITSNTLIDQWRVAIVLIAVLAAVITPSIDPVTMILTMAPLIVLYILSILLARVGTRQFERSMEV